MSSIKDITKIITDQKNNHSVYAWGGSGQLVSGMTIDDVFKLEASSDDPITNAQRVFDRIVKNKRTYGTLKDARAFDCSGLILYALNNLGIIVGDYTANQLYTFGEQITLKSAKEGDLVFKGTKTNKTHVGYVIGGGRVIEAKGRDYGVVESNLTEWTYACRYYWLDNGVLTRKLKYVKDKMISGTDVMMLQKALCSHGCLCAINGTFTENTKEAVIKFQKLFKPNPAAGATGTIAKKSALALGFTWKS